MLQQFKQPKKSLSNEISAMLIEKSSQRVVISDATLRDGNHAVSHQINEENIRAYAKWAESAGADWIEIGHGNGLGASSFQIGHAAITDESAIMAARQNLTRASLSVHVMPGIATIERDIQPAIDLGVDIFRIAAHCTEANTTLRFLNYVRDNGKTAVGVLMMSHMSSPSEFLDQARLMQSAGAEAIMLMDSAGSLNPKQIKERFEILTNELEIATGIHAHNNLGYATTNTMVAVQTGARIVDACIAGFGAGAGNAQMELVVPLLHDEGFIDFDGADFFEVAERALKSFVTTPRISSLTIATGRAGLFSGYLKPIQKISSEYGLSPFSIIEELGKRKVVAGQEDLILEVAKFLAKSAE
jgi:4-hydroxy 2-oxovalerate aldolase